MSHIYFRVIGFALLVSFFVTWIHPWPQWLADASEVDQYIVRGLMVTLMTINVVTAEIIEAINKQKES